MCQRFAQDLISFSEKVWVEYFLAILEERFWFYVPEICTGSYFFFRKSMGRVFLSHIGGTLLVLCARDLHRILFLF